jgi:lysophospholipase L1-like esterase
MERRNRALVAMVLLLVGAGCQRRSWAPTPGQWEEALRSFEEQDGENPPPRNPILFVGSSSIRLWNTAQSFPSLDVVNRGFGGSTLPDLIAASNRLIIRYDPRVVVIYAGDNDLALGASAPQVVSGFRQLAKKIEAALPRTRIVFISIKPSPARWSLIEKSREANRGLRAMVAADPRLAYVDVEPAMLGGDGKPRKDLFVEDGLHMNEQGEQLWARLVAPHITEVASGAGPAPR